MSHWLGLDLGTSSVRAVLVTGDGDIAAMESRSYGISSPLVGWAEQDPDHWWALTCDAVSALLAGQGLSGRDIAAVGLTGQMHGLVLVDNAGRPVRPAIAWPDRRSTAQVARCASLLTSDQVRSITGMSPSTGLLGPSLAWVRDHEPEVHASATRALLPKDYLRAMLTGQYDTEPTDACGTLLYDITSGTWSPTMLDAFGIDEKLMPRCVTSESVVGVVTAAVSTSTGLAEGTPVVAGGGDQATSALALGLSTPGDTSVAISSGGTVVQVASQGRRGRAPGVHTLCSVDGGHLLMGATLTAGLALTWLADTVLRLPEVGRTDAVGELMHAAADVPRGAGGLLFLPYLAGERTPHFDPLARGCLLGLTREHGPAHLVRAVLEGVALALRDCFDAVTADGELPDHVVAAGGGARSAVWRQILADTLGREIRLSPVGEHSATGAALLAARGSGAVVRATTACTVVHEPDAAAGEFYAERLALFRDSYRRTSPIHHALNSSMSAT